MKKAIYISYIALIATHCISVFSISIVYNFRIAQITKQPLTEKNNHNTKDLIVGLLFDQYQKKYTGDIYQNFTGCLGSFIRNFISDYYLRIDGAISHIHATQNHTTTFSGTTTDDLLITLSRDLRFSQEARCAISGLFGFPTHDIFTLQHPDFGYGQFGTGIQFDGTYDLNEQSAFIYGARYIHFFPRTARDSSGKKYKFSIGNLTDLLCAVKTNIGNHGIETGYTRRWDFSASIFPYDPITLQKTNYIRNNFYCVYKYKFTAFDLQNRFLCNISYGYEEKSRIYGNQYVFTTWIAWNVTF